MAIQSNCRHIDFEFIFQCGTQNDTTAFDE